MANRGILAVIGLVVVGGGVGAWLLSGESSGLDASGQALLTRHAAMVQELPDSNAVRELLREVQVHPAGGKDSGLLRAQAWLFQRLGNSRRAWEMIEGNLIDPVPADLDLSAEILQCRHGETGDVDLADRARSCSEQHYEMTDSMPSLFRAWQMAVRTDDLERAARHAASAKRDHSDSRESRVIAALVGYPNEVDDTEASAERFGQLMDEFINPPEELCLALAWSEINRPDTILSGQQRAERVQQAFRVSKTARTIIAFAALKLEQYKKSQSHSKWLLDHYPQHPKAKVWGALLAAAQDGAANGK